MDIIDTTWPIFRHIRKIAKGDYGLRPVCLSVHVKQLNSQWTDFL